MSQPILTTSAAIGPQGSTGRLVADLRAGPSAQGWFAGGERIGYDPKAHAIVAAQDAPLKIFLRREGDLAHAVSFLPGFPDGSFGLLADYSPNPDRRMDGDGALSGNLRGNWCDRGCGLNEWWPG